MFLKALKSEGHFNLLCRNLRVVLWNARVKCKYYWHRSPLSFKYIHTHPYLNTYMYWCRILCAAKIIDSIKFKLWQLYKSVGNYMNNWTLCCCITTYYCRAVSGYMVTRVCVQLVTFPCMNSDFAECDEKMKLMLF